MLRKLQNWRYH